jgi:hypothetical protein
MRQNIFLGGGPFGSQQVAVMGPTLGQIQSSYQWNTFARPLQSTYQWAPRPSPAQRLTRPTGRPTAAAAGSSSDVHCYFCSGLSGAPTYWMSEAQSNQWNQDRDAKCEKVKESDCREKYGQMPAQTQQANLRRTGFNVINFPNATTYAPAMSSCRHDALGKPYLGEALRCWKTADGGTVCSDLKYHPPGCPSTPAVTESQVLATPPEASQAVCGGGGITVSPSAIPSSTPAPEQPSAFPVVPVAVGGVALIGLLLVLS